MIPRERADERHVVGEDSVFRYIRIIIKVVRAFELCTEKASFVCC